MSLFFAINPPAGARAEIAAAVTDLRGAAPGAAWSPPDDYHVTLAYLGRFNADIVALAEQAGATISAAAFALTLDRVGAFDRAGTKPIWLGLAYNDGLVQHRERLVLALRAVGVEFDEQKFTPHLTIAHAREPLAATAIPAITWTADSVDLMARRPGAVGYETLRRFPIGGR